MGDPSPLAPLVERLIQAGFSASGIAEQFENGILTYGRSRSYCCLLCRKPDTDNDIMIWWNMPNWVMVHANCSGIQHLNLNDCVLHSTLRGFGWVPAEDILSLAPDPIERAAALALPKSREGWWCFKSEILRHFVDLAGFLDVLSFGHVATKLQMEPWTQRCYYAPLDTNDPDILVISATVSLTRAIELFFSPPLPWKAIQIVV